MKTFAIIVTCLALCACHGGPRAVKTPAPAPGSTSQQMIEQQHADSQAERRCGGVAHTGRSNSSDRDKQTAWDICMRTSR